MFEIEELTLMVGGTNLKLKTAVKPFGSHENDVTRNFTHTEFRTLRKNNLPFNSKKLKTIEVDRELVS